MQYFFKLITLWLLLINLACNTKSTNNYFIYNIDLKDTKEDIDTDALIDSVFVVPLETNPNIQVGGIKKILFHTNRCIILDKNERVFVFTVNGEFVTHIGSRGRARGEYISCTDISISNNKIYLFDIDKQQIHEYQVSDFQYIKSYTYKYGSSCAVVVNDYIFGKNATGYTSLSSSKLDDSENTKCELLSYEKIFDSKMRDQMVTSNQQTFWIDPGKGEFYELNPNGELTSFLKFNEPNIVLNEDERLVVRNSTDINKYGKMSNLYRFLVTNQYMLFEYILNDKFFQFIYDRSNSTKYNFNLFKSNAPFTQLFFISQAVYNNYFVTYFDNIHFAKVAYKNYVDEFGVPKKKYSDFTKFEMIGENDNPIIIYYKMKDNN